MPFTVQIFANDAAHRFGDDVRHLQANRLGGPLALGVDIPAGRLDDAAGVLPGLLLSLLLNPLGSPVRLLDDLPCLQPRLLNLVLGRLQPRLSFLARLFCLLQLLLDLQLARFRRLDNRWIDPPRQHAQHQQEGDDLGDQGAVDGEQPGVEQDDRKMQSTSPRWPRSEGTRLNSSHSQISYAVFCLKKKNTSRDNKLYEDDKTPAQAILSKKKKKEKVQPFYTMVFFFNDTATTEIYTLSLHDALPIR